MPAFQEDQPAKQQQSQCDQASTRLLTDDNGDIKANYAYDAYGNVQGSDPGYTKYLYAGEQYDKNLGWHYLRHRYYLPTIGIFNRPDPFQGDPFAPQSLHKYAYVWNDPVNNIDLSGNIKFSLVGMLTTAMIVGLLAGIGAGVVTTIRGGTSQQIQDAMLRWFLIGFVAGGAVYAGAWALHSLLVAAFGSTAGLGTLQYAQQYGIRPYADLTKALKGTGLHAHHIVPERFATTLGLRAREMLCIAATKVEHQPFTNAWISAIPKVTGTANATPAEIWFHAQRIYEEYPALVEVSRAQLGM